ncbi:MAG: serine hydrolase domain-containing protein, partial [Pseudomonadota bacterium]
YLDFEIPPFDGPPITLRHILTHTPGFEESLRYIFTDPAEGPMPLADYVRRALPNRVFPAGTVPAYSNYASSLAGYIVESSSGMAFNDYIADNIFAPLGMANSTFEQPLPARLAPQMSRGYADTSQPARPFEILSAAPAGALSATGADMGRFMVAHLNQGRDLLDPATAEIMQTYRAPKIDGLNGMALGFYEKEVNGRRAIGHGGDTLGFHSDLTLFPEDGVGLYISLNSTGNNGASFALRQLLLEQFADRYLPEVGAKDVVPGVDAATAAAHLDLVSGSYIASRGSFTNFLSFGGFLGQVTLGKTADGKLSFPLLDTLGLGPFDWVEVAPFIWQDRFSSQTVAAEVVDGQVLRVSTDIYSPVTVLLPTTIWQDVRLWGPLLGLALVIVALQAVLWPVRQTVRRSFGIPLILPPSHLWMYRLTGIFSIGILLAVMGWAVFLGAVSAQVTLLGGGLDWLINGLRILLPAAAIGLALAATAHLALSLQRGGAWVAHLGRILLLLSALVILWTIFTYHLYGLDLRF